MKQTLLLLISLLAFQASAQQTSDVLSVLVSEAYSIFTSITQSLGQATATSNGNSQPTSSVTPLQTGFATGSSSPDSSVEQPTITTSPSTAVASSFGSSTTSPSSTTAASSSQSSSSSSSSTGNTSQSGSAAAASATSSAAATGGSHHDRNLAIILGTVLGALALGLLILLLLLLCRRRRRRRTATGRNSALLSSSDEALTPHKTAHSHVTPVASSLHGRSHSPARGVHATPAMSERRNYDVPSAHNFHDGSSAPFMPGGLNSNRPDGNYNSGFPEDVTGNGVHHRDHHTGSALAAGAGGAALGAAAARHHSRSSERNRRSRLSKDHGVHPTFSDEPVPRSPHRNSTESAKRRSGSGLKGTFYGPQDLAKHPIRDGASAAALGGATGAVTNGVAGHHGRDGHERGRSLPYNSPAYNGYSDGSSSSAANGLPARGRGASHEMPPMITPPMGGNHVHPHDRNVAGPAIAGAALGAAATRHRRSRSRSGSSHPSLPPALTIQTPAHRRNLSSRSPKRTRFADGSVAHEPMPYESDTFNSSLVSPPTMGPSYPRNSTYTPLSPDTLATEDVISPVSPEDTSRTIGQGMPVSSGRANLVNIPRSRSISPNPATMKQRRQHSGLVSAVQDHLDPQGTAATHSGAHSYRPYAVGAEPVGHINNNNADLTHDDIEDDITMRRPNGVGPINRKPVPYSSYNSTSGATRPSAAEPLMPTDIDVDSRRNSWWRRLEDSEWENSYSDNRRSGDGSRYSATAVGTAR